MAYTVERLETACLTSPQSLTVSSLKQIAEHLSPIFQQMCFDCMMRNPRGNNVMFFRKLQSKTFLWPMSYNVPTTSSVENRPNLSSLVLNCTLNGHLTRDKTRTSIKYHHFKVIKQKVHMRNEIQERPGEKCSRFFTGHDSVSIYIFSPLRIILSSKHCHTKT